MQTSITKKLTKPYSKTLVWLAAILAAATNPGIPWRN